MVERLAELLCRKNLVLDSAAGFLSTAAPQSSSAFCSGCEAGTQCEILSSMVFSCANAGVTLAASSNAKNAFLIDIPSSCCFGLWSPFADIVI